MTKQLRTRARHAALAAAVAALAAAFAPVARAGTVEVSGVTLDDTAVVAGQTLVLNGAGYRKRGYFKVDVTALYLQAHAATVDQVEKMPGAKRLELVIQKDISGAQASRYFLNDFEGSAQPMEFAQLINEVSQIGDIYSGIRQIHKGDIVTIDVIPGKGALASLNGTALVPHGAKSPYFSNDLLARILLRMYIGGKTPEDLRKNLLGHSHDMIEKVTAGPSPAAAPATAAAAKPAGHAPTARQGATSSR